MLIFCIRLVLSIVNIPTSLLADSRLGYTLQWSYTFLYFWQKDPPDETKLVSGHRWSCFQCVCGCPQVEILMSGMCLSLVSLHTHVCSTRLYRARYSSSPTHCNDGIDRDIDVRFGWKQWLMQRCATLRSTSASDEDAIVKDVVFRIFRLFAETPWCNYWTYRLLTKLSTLPQRIRDSVNFRVPCWSVWNTRLRKTDEFVWCAKPATRTNHCSALMRWHVIVLWSYQLLKHFR